MIVGTERRKTSCGCNFFPTMLNEEVFFNTLSRALEGRGTDYSLQSIFQPTFGGPFSLIKLGDVRLDI